MANLLTVVALCLTMTAVVTNSQLYNSGGQGSTQCKYEFTVSSPQGCAGTDQDLKASINKMKMDVDRGRLSQVSHNSAVQRQVSQLRTDVDRVDTSLDTLQTRVDNLQAPTANNQLLTKVQNDNFALNTLLLNIRDNLEQKLSGMELMMGSLNITLAVERVERFKVEASLQAQIRDQNQELTKMASRLDDLEQKFTSAVPSAPSKPSGTTII